MSFTFQEIDSSQPIFNTNISVSEQETITDASYIQEIKNKLKVSNHKIIYYEIYQPLHPDLQKIKLTKKNFNYKNKKKMTVWDNLANISNSYSGFEYIILHIFDLAKKVVQGVRTGGDFINEKLDQLLSIPYLGSAVKESINKAKDYKVFGVASFNDLMGYTRFIDDTLQRSDIAERVASTADYYITPVVEFGSKIGQVIGGQLENTKEAYSRGIVSAGWLFQGLKNLEKVVKYVC